MVTPALEPLGTTFIVFIVAIFFLIQKQDLRDRLIRLMGIGDLHRTTLALDDGAKRLSRYFLAQFAINTGFGAVVWAGLFMLDVPAPGLWGILAGLLRFVPYVGTLIAVLGPLALAAAIDPGWTLVLEVGLLFVVLEPVVGYLVEPLLYGRSTGLSPVSVIVAALFWTWIWGPVGLVLSMPLTLTLVVLGRHIPAFAVFDILLGDRPALTPVETFYQRILAGNTDEAIDEAEALLQTTSVVQFYDEIVLEALRLAAADVDRGAVGRASLGPVCEATCTILGALAPYTLLPAGGRGTTTAATAPGEGRTVLCVPGRGPLDAAISTMVAQVLRDAGFVVEEQARDRAFANDNATILASAADHLCFLGLFDERSAARMQPLLGGIAAQSPGREVSLGVCRTNDPAECGAALAYPPAASIGALCKAIAEHGPVQDEPRVAEAAALRS